jgi:uncharacterized protein
VTNQQISEPYEWRPPRSPRRRRGRLLLVALAALVLGGTTTVSYYVESLWFGSLGYGQVFWTTLNLQGLIFTLFAALTFAVLYGAFRILKPARFADLGAGGVIFINGRPVRLPVEPVIRAGALLLAILAALVAGAGFMGNWSTLALWWYGKSAAAPAGISASDPIFGRPLSFYLFTLPALDLIGGWLTLLAILTCGIALFFVVVAGGTRVLKRGRDKNGTAIRGLSIAWAFFLLTLAVRAYLGRFDRLLQPHSIFTGVTYADAHVFVPGTLLVSIALIAGALGVTVAAVMSPRTRWLVAAVLPAAVCYLGMQAVGWYVGTFVVRPNELVREQPYIAHNIELTRQAFGLHRLAQRPFEAATTPDAVDPARNQATLQNIRLWDWRALQDTLRQIQEIRTYYDFPDIDIDRYPFDGVMRQVMLATRELSVQKLPESSRTWINEKLIYTHGYGVTMNLVNGFTPEGLPSLILSNMPVQSTVPDLTVTRPEVYFGELTDTDVYVKTRQKEFNYPQGQTNSLTTYEGTGGIVLGGFFRRLLIAFDRGDLTKLPFSDDVTADSRLLMRRNVRDRAAALAPFLTFDDDPYVVIRKDGRLAWMMDGFTASASYPYSRAYRLAGRQVNYVRNSVKAVIDAYDGTTTFYVFEPDDPIIGVYRAIFPSLFKDAAAMPADLRSHVRYPELLLQIQAEAYGLYHMTVPDVFYNREDLWTVAGKGASTERGAPPQPMEPNFVLMTLPGESGLEFIEILPFTPANRNNLIGWIAGRSDAPNYGNAVVFDFPKSKLVDGPLQIEARIDQHPQLSSQLSLWNQQGSRVRRGELIVIPIGRALLYAEPIYLQAERSPMPELRLVVLALQDRLAFGPSLEAALTGLFGADHAPKSTTPPTPSSATPSPAGGQESGADREGLIKQAAQDLADYQRLTAEGKLGEAGQKLEHLKRTLEELSKRPR